MFQPKTPYEVTEKYPDPPTQVSAKIEQPIGFSKATVCINLLSMRY